MTITEANAVNTVLRYFLNVEGPSGAIPDSDSAGAAAALLANNAHQRLVAEAAAKGQTDAEVARLKPGPKRDGQTDVTERLDVARCTVCHTHHDDNHVCPGCGDETPVEVPRIKPYVIREWALAQGLSPVPSRGPLPERITAAYAAAHPTQTEENQAS